MKMLTEAELMDLLREAYTLGFKSSDQDFNGATAIWSQLEDDYGFVDDRDSDLMPLIHADSGGYDGKGNKV